VAQTQDEAFHEIQLNGKQLVFLFMAATVVSVVIFLCGVLVGRNVRAERAQVDVPSASADLPTPAPAPAQASATENTQAYTGAGKASPKEDLLKKPERSAKADLPAPVTTAPPSAPVPEPKATLPADPPPAAAPAPEKAAPPPVPAPSATSGTETSDKGYAVQIAAVNARSEADAMAKRLASKGYSAYVLSPASGTPPVYRVRVGKFPTKREAETVAAKLQKEEQLKPWVTR
jgi:cell division septation protein DedD